MPVILTYASAASPKDPSRTEQVRAPVPGLGELPACCRVTVKPVLDLAGVAPVDGYEIPDRLREAVHLLSPADVFPYATSTRRCGDIDHTGAYTPPISITP